MKKEKVLIIKTGYSEILDDRNNSRRVSLGDVLRTTPLLNLYKDKLVTWVSDIEAFPLLDENPYIHRLIPYDFTTAFQLEAEEFDTIINLEKIPGICALSDKIKARRNRYGFTFNSQTGEAEAYDKAINVLSVSSNPREKKENQFTTQELLFDMVGQKWDGEGYVLGYKPKQRKKYDVGLNTKIGQKWPTKSWSKEKWNSLEEKLKKEGFSVTRQEEVKELEGNLDNYMDWINSCNVIVTNDSLGLHLGIALKKKVIGLFGPTPYKEIFFYGCGKAIYPEPSPKCMPCFKGKCKRGKKCMEDIPIEKVYEEILKLK